MDLIYKLGINHYWVDEDKKKTGRKGDFCSTAISFWDPSSKHILKHFYKPTVSEEISTPIAFQSLLQPDNCICFIRDLRSSISNCSHCFILLNGFSNLPWLNLILALCVNCKWGYTDFILCKQLVKEHWLAILIAVLEKSYLTPKNIGNAFAMKSLSCLGSDAQWGHTVKATLSVRNVLCSLETYLLLESCLLHGR